MRSIAFSEDNILINFVQNRRKERDMRPTTMQRRLSRFFGKKYYPERSGGVEIFFQKPAGLDLYCRKAEWVILHIPFFLDKRTAVFLNVFIRKSNVFRGGWSGFRSVSKKTTQVKQP